MTKSYLKKKVLRSSEDVMHNFPATSFMKDPYNRKIKILGQIPPN